MVEFKINDEQLESLNTCTPIMKASLSLLSALIKFLPYTECEIEYRHEQGKDCGVKKAINAEMYPNYVILFKYIQPRRCYC